MQTEPQDAESGFAEAPDGTRIHWTAVGSGAPALVRDTVDAITILDVLYLLPIDEKRRLLARARQGRRDQPRLRA